MLTCSTVHNADLRILTGSNSAGIAALLWPIDVLAAARKIQSHSSSAGNAALLSVLRRRLKHRRRPSEFRPSTRST